MFLAKPCPSLPIIWKLFWLIGWPVLLLWWCIGGSLALESFSKGPIGFPHVFIRTLHWNQYMAPLLLTIGSLSLGETRRFLIMLLPLKWVWITYLLQIFLMLFAETLDIWYYYVTLGFDFIGNRLGTSGALAVSPIIDLTRRPVKSSLYLAQSPFQVFTLGKCLPDMVHFLLEKLRIATYSLALCVKVLITLYLAERWWWLFHSKYWSMWVSFLYTPMDNLPSAPGVTIVSKKGMAPSSLLFSTVNCIARSMLLLCYRKFCLFTSFRMTMCHP